MLQALVKAHADTSQLQPGERVPLFFTLNMKILEFFEILFFYSPKLTFVLENIFSNVCFSLVIL